MRGPIRRPLRRPDEAGLTLPELVVSMMISTLVFVLGATMLTTTLRERRFGDARTTSQADARVAVELLTRDLRTAVPPPNTSSSSAFAFAAPRKITFYTRSGGATTVYSKITYEVDATSNCLRRTVIRGTGSPVTFPSTNASTRCAAPGGVNTGGEALFSFYRLRVDASTAPTEITAPSAGYSTPTDDATLKFIASVRLTMHLRAQGAPTVSGTVVDQWVTLINQSNAIRSGKIS